MSHRYGIFSWWWAYICPKHVEKSNKHIKKIYALSLFYLQHICLTVCSFNCCKHSSRADFHIYILCCAERLRNLVIFSLGYSLIQMLYKMLRRFHISEPVLISVFENVEKTTHWIMLTFRHHASCILGQAFHYSPENVFYIFNQQIYFIIWYLLDRASLI